MQNRHLFNFNKFMSIVLTIVSFICSERSQLFDRLAKIIIMAMVRDLYTAQL